MITHLIPPMAAFFDHRRRHVTRTATYSQSGCKLDVWRGDHQASNAPILIFVPGGAWASGSRMTFQGQALLTRMVEQGWVCLSIDYRTAPLHQWPAPLMDVYAAVHWARAHAHEFGGDKNFVAIAGASAGGHMATLTGLLPGMVDACVSIYGSYDWESRDSVWRTLFMEYLERIVVQQRYTKDPELFRAASPMARINPDAAPMFMVHGTKDVLIYVDEARRFYRKLDAVSHSPVKYLEINNAVHAFDLLHPQQTVKANRAIAGFLNDTWRRASRRAAA
jgi:acetyl esterase/lipase